MPDEEAEEAREGLVEEKGFFILPSELFCNDLTSGLSAEIEARRKQYEYYRDKLLIFKEAKA